MKYVIWGTTDKSGDIGNNKDITPMFDGQATKNLYDVIE